MSALSDVTARLARPAVDVLALGVATERRARAAVSRSAGRAAVGLLDSALASPAAEEAVDLILDSPLLEHALGRAMESPMVARLAGRVIDSPQAEELVGRVIDSRLLDAAVVRLLDSKDLWLLVDEVARSPSVTEAISHQGVGFAEQMAGVVRQHSHSADERVERLARRLTRRRAAQ